MVCQDICLIKRERFEDINIDECPIEWALFKPTNHTTISEFVRKFVNQGGKSGSTSAHTPTVLPSYFHGTPRYFHCTSGSTEVDEVSLFPPWLCIITIK